MDESARLDVRGVVDEVLTGKSEPEPRDVGFEEVYELVLLVEEEDESDDVEHILLAVMG